MPEETVAQGMADGGGPAPEERGPGAVAGTLRGAPPVPQPVDGDGEETPARARAGEDLEAEAANTIPVVQHITFPGTAAQAQGDVREALRDAAE
jgi:hypothetical protein